MELIKTNQTNFANCSGNINSIESLVARCKMLSLWCIFRIKKKRNTRKENLLVLAYVPSIDHIGFWSHLKGCLPM